MAIGDAIAIYLGTSAANRQPSSGVEEQISAIVKPEANAGNGVGTYDGSNVLDAFIAASQSNEVITDAKGFRMEAYNMSIMITNSVYIRKAGDSDRVYFGGVQTNV